MTIHDAEVSRQAAFASGADAFLHKGDTVTDLVPTIRRVVAEGLGGRG